MNKILLLLIAFTFTLSAIETLPMQQTGGTQSISSSCSNSLCTITLNTGTQLYFSIKNDTNQNLKITKFEISKTYNGSTVIESTTTDQSLLGGNSFSHNETVNLGYTTIYAQIANYWTATYYITNLDTGEKFSNSLRWDNDFSSSSVVAEDLTEFTRNVSNTAELRTALTQAANDGRDDIIVLANGTYKTTDDGLGQFKYSTSEKHTLTLRGSSSANVILDGDKSSRVLYIYGGTSLHLEKLTVQNGHLTSNQNGAGVYVDKTTDYYQHTDVYLDSVTIKDNNATDWNSGGGLYIKDGNIYVLKSVIENNYAYNGGGFYSNRYAGSNAEIRRSIIRNNSVYDTLRGGAGFYSDYAQIYNS